MNMKKTCKRFWRLGRGAEGFTLVELIVVIAILAILAGVAVPVYSTYVEQANKQADITLVSEVENALLLAYYNGTLKDGGKYCITLSSDGEVQGVDAGSELEQALIAAFGSGYKNALKLKYAKWGNGAAVTQDVINYFMTVDKESPLYDIFNGNADISYVDNIPELFALMEDTAILIAGKRESLGSGANMVTDAAKITNSMTIPEDYEGTATTPAEYFSELWASSAWDSDYLMQGSGSDYNGNAGNLTDEKLTNAIANAAVIKARNVALATYLKDLGYPEAYDAIANYTYKDASGNATAVPDDAAAIIMKELNGESVTVEEAAFLKTVFAGADIAALGGAIVAYYDDSTGDSQAYTDGLAYYAMMSTVDNLKDSTNLDKTNDETWWNDLYSAVDMYSAVANGEASLADLNNLYSNMGTVSGNTVLVMLMVQNGVPSVMISPVGANP